MLQDFNHTSGTAYLADDYSNPLYVLPPDPQTLASLSVL